MRRPARSGLWLALLTACLSVAALTTAPASASPVTTAHATAPGLRASVPDSNSWIQLSNRYSARCIDDPGQSWTVGQQMQQYDCTLTAAQQWEPLKEANGNYRIQNNHNPLCLADEGSWIGEGVPVIQPPCDGSTAVEWDLTPISGLGGTYYLSSPANQGRVLSV